MSKFMKEYKKKPVVIKAFKLTEEWIDKNKKQWNIEKSNETGVVITDDKAIVNTLEGVMKANINDFIIKGINNELYPCKPSVFHETYERTR